MEGWSAGVVGAYRGSDRPAVITPGAMVTGSGLLAAAAGAASWFESLGLPAGLPLPALVTTSADTLAMLLGGAAAGHPLAPLGPRLTAAELSGAVSGLGGQVLLHEPAFAGLAAELARVTGVRPIPVTGLPYATESAGWPPRTWTRWPFTCTPAARRARPSGCRSPSGS
jgi:acyl-CoA synthetase (AMP-forming)/AMP-acid ligase II